MFLSFGLTTYRCRCWRRCRRRHLHPFWSGRFSFSPRRLRLFSLFLSFLLIPLPLFSLIFGWPDDQDDDDSVLFLLIDGGGGSVPCLCFTQLPLCPFPYYKKKKTRKFSFPRRRRRWGYTRNDCDWFITRWWCVVSAQLVRSASLDVTRKRRRRPVGDLFFPLFYHWLQWPLVCAQRCSYFFIYCYHLGRCYCCYSRVTHGITRVVATVRQRGAVRRRRGCDDETNHPCRVTKDRNDYKCNCTSLLVLSDDDDDDGNEED